ncbi:MAG: hypothetical protein IKS19_03870 [Clostridia bacterium]|nr:hypothetical protein [Clostridia bacterium]
MRDKKVENLMRRIGNLIREKWWIVVITTIIGLGLAYGATTFMDREYSASVLIFANSKSDANKNEQVTSSDVSLINSLIADYRLFATSRTLIENVNAELAKDKLGSISVNKVSVASQGNSRGFTITVKNGDPMVCYKAAEYIAEQLKSTIKEYYDMDNVEIIDHAKVPNKPVAPDVRSIMLFGGFVGFFLGVGLLYLILMLDKAIKSVEDFESNFDIPVLGVIPEFDKMQVQSKVGQSNGADGKNQTTIIREIPKETEKEISIDQKPFAASADVGVPETTEGFGGTAISETDFSDTDDIIQRYLNEADELLSRTDFEDITSGYDGKEGAESNS